MLSTPAVGFSTGSLQAPEGIQGEAHHPEESVDDSDEDRAAPRIYLALVRRSSTPTPENCWIEKSRLAELRTALADPDIVEVLSVIKGVKKVFQVKTEMVKKIIIGN